MALHLTGDAAADRLLSEDPLALVTGMLLDQQFPMERAFAAPAELLRRLDRPGLDAGELAAMDPERLVEVFATRPALHRYPGSMARRVHALAQVVHDQYGDGAANIWLGAATGPQLLGRVNTLPGFGERKARIFVALLGKQLGVRPRGWRQASSPFGDPGTSLSIADVTGPESLASVRATKQAQKQAAKAVTRQAAEGTPRR